MDEIWFIYLYSSEVITDTQSIMWLHGEAVQNDLGEIVSYLTTTKHNQDPDLT